MHSRSAAFIILFLVFMLTEQIEDRASWKHPLASVVLFERGPCHERTWLHIVETCPLMTCLSTYIFIHADIIKRRHNNKKMLSLPLIGNLRLEEKKYISVSSVHYNLHIVRIASVWNKFNLLQHNKPIFYVNIQQNILNLVSF